MEQQRNVSYELKIISNLIRRYEDKSAIRKYIDSVTGTNGWIIRYLAENPDKDIFQRDLEEKFSIRRSTVSSIIKLMEQKGFISRVPVEHDARLKKLVLTDKAYEIHAVACKDISELENKLSKDLTEEELNTFFNIIDKIKNNIELEE